VLIPIALFTVTLLGTVWMLLQISRRASPARHHAIQLLLFVWLILTGVLAATQFFSNFQRMPPALPPFILFAVICVTVIAAKMPPGVPLFWLIGYQAFRIPVEIFLHQGFQAGFVPAQMTWEGRNFDVLTGLTALPIAWLASRNALPNWAAHLWNVAGFALLVNIMTIAVLSFPTPLRQFYNEPANVFVTQLPFVWLPTMLVPAAWFGHIAVFRRLRATGPSAEDSEAP
jgi:hypothetical protein